MMRRPPRSTLFPYTTHIRSHSNTTRPPAGIVVPCQLISDVAVRTWYCTGDSKRSSSSTAGAISIRPAASAARWRSEEHTSELQSRQYLVCRLLLEKKNQSDN